MRWGSVSGELKLRVKNLLLILLMIHSFYAVAQTSTGTGFFITANGYLATNYHVIDGAEIISVRDTAGTFFKANIVATDKINDLAILYIGGTHNSLNLLPSQGVRSGKKVFTMGFPHIDIQGGEAKFTEGTISSSSGLGNDPRVYQISVPVQAGNSGGPLATQEGGVVGIVTAKIDALSILKSTGDLPQNVNYAIKSSYLLGLVSAFPEIEKNLLSEKKKTFTDTQKLAEHLSKAIVLIFAESPEVQKLQPNNENALKHPKPENVPEKTSAFPESWVSIQTGNRFSLHINENKLTYELTYPGQGKCTMTQRGEATKNGDVFNGSAFSVMTCPPSYTSCPMSGPISLIITPSRIEGKIRAWNFNPNTCAVSGFVDNPFVWVPQ